MATKKAVKKVTRVRGEALYEAYSSKIEAHRTIGKKAADKECTSHTPLVAQVLMNEFSKPASFEQILSAVKATKRYESDAVERCIRGDLAILVREGLAKKIVAEAPKAENGTAKKAVKRAKKLVKATEAAAETLKEATA